MPLENINNALTGDSWPFGPPQSGIDIFENRMNGGAGPANWSLPIAGEPAQSMGPDALGYLEGEVTFSFLYYGNTFNISLKNHALDSSTINGFLSDMAAFAAANPTAAPTLDISGGSNAAPTSGPGSDLQALLNAGWTVLYNN